MKKRSNATKKKPSKREYSPASQVDGTHPAVQPPEFFSLLPPVDRTPPALTPVGMCHPAEGPPHCSRAPLLAENSHPPTTYDRLNPNIHTRTDLLYAPSQRFRVVNEDGLAAIQHRQEEIRAARQRITRTFDSLRAILSADVESIRTCPNCKCRLLNTEEDVFCCNHGRRLHLPWPVLPHDLRSTDFKSYARVINCLLSPVVMHGATKGEGFSHRFLSYQRSVMTLSGTVYNRAHREQKNCWFLHDANYDERLRLFLSNAKQVAVLHRFTAVLQQYNRLFSPAVADHPLPSGSQVYLEIPEETRMCSVYVYDGQRTDFAPARNMILVGSGQSIDELSPLWELYGYPTMHFTGDLRYVWSEQYQSMRGDRMTLLQYLKSVLMSQSGFWRFGRLAEHYILDMWARQDQVNMRSWLSPPFQDKLRSYAVACGRSVPEGKIFLPSGVPGSYVYQRRFFHDVLHIARMKGPSHLFVTFTCNPDWPEIRALIGGDFDANLDSHQDIIARVFVHKRKQLIDRLESNNYLFEGHRGVVWISYTTEWQKGDLPHAHIACRLGVDTAIQPMATQMDQIRLMDKVISARKPAPGDRGYDQVVLFMQHPDPCKSCMQTVRGGSEKRCRFRFPKPTCECSRIDAKGFPVYRRGPDDIRIVPHCVRVLEEFCCHCNFEWTFNSLHFAYLYSYMCKGVDTASFRIRDQLDEITAFRKARILTVAECVYRCLGFNVNFRHPAVVVCPIYLPRRRVVPSGENVGGLEMFGQVFDGNDEFGDHENEAWSQFPPEVSMNDEDIENGASPPVRFKLDFLQHYFIADRPPDMTFCDYYANYRLDGSEWKQRKKPILARMQWYPPSAGAIYFLRTLLWQIPATSFADLYGGYATFREHCIALGLVPDGEEYLHGMRDAKTCGHSPASLRHLYAMFIVSIDATNLGAIWEDQDLRFYMASDFLEDGHEDAMGYAETLALMDIAAMVSGMGGGKEFQELFTKSSIPLPPAVHCLPDYHGHISLDHSEVFNRYAATVGYSIKQRAVVSQERREIVRFLETTRLLSDDQMSRELETLNVDQRCLFDELFSKFKQHLSGFPHTEHLFNVNASGGCGKTYLMRVFLNAVRRLGVVTVSVSSIGIGALQFDDGQTVHSMFKIPIHEETDVIAGDVLTSRLMKTIEDEKSCQRVEFLRAASLIVWDEISPIRNTVFRAVDSLFRRLCNKPSIPFGGKFFVFTGDWKQLPPVDETLERTRFWDGDATAFESIYFLSVKSTDIFKNSVTKRTLTLNERAKDDEEFQRDLHLIGNGLSIFSTGDIPIDAFGFRIFYDLKEAMDWLFVEDESIPYDPRIVARKALMSPYNTEVDAINTEAAKEYIQRYRAEIVTLLSVDEFVGGDVSEEDPKEPVDVRRALQREAFRQEEENLRGDMDGLPAQRPFDGDEGHFFDIADAMQRVALGSDTFNLEVLHTQTFPGMPPHELKLHRGQTVILLRNLDARTRLQNGVRLIIKDFVKGNRLIAVMRADDVIEGIKDPPIFLLPRIVFEGNMGHSKETMMTRRQFPVRACASVSIHKCQSMTLVKGVIDVRDGVFEHGQLFCAASRCRLRRNTAFLARPDQKTVRNIVLQSFADER